MAPSLALRGVLDQLATILDGLPTVRRHFPWVALVHAIAKLVEILLDHYGSEIDNATKPPENDP